MSGLFALAANDTEPLFVYLAYLPAVAFWALDGYFLWQERLFRSLYDDVRQRNEEEVDFSMDTNGVPNPPGGWWRATTSLTLRLFHGAVVFTILVVMLVIALSK